MIFKTNVLNQIMKTLMIEPEKPQILRNAVWENLYYTLVTLNIQYQYHNNGIIYIILYYTTQAAGVLLAV